MTVKLTYEFVKEQFEKEGYKLLSEKYKNHMSKLRVECTEGINIMLYIIVLKREEDVLFVMDYRDLDQTVQIGKVVFLQKDIFHIHQKNIKYGG